MSEKSNIVKEVICRNCGKHLFFSRVKKEQEAELFCSRKCADEWVKEHKSDEEIKVKS